MVMVVAHPILITRSRACWLDAPNDALLRQKPQRVVHRLPRNGTNFVANILGYVVRRTMGAARNRTQHGNALRGDVDLMFPKEFSWVVGHTMMIEHILDLVKI